MNVYPFPSNNFSAKLNIFCTVQRVRRIHGILILAYGILNIEIVCTEQSAYAHRHDHDDGKIPQFVRNSLFGNVCIMVVWFLYIIYTHPTHIKSMEIEKALLYFAKWSVFIAYGVIFLPGILF